MLVVVSSSAMTASADMMRARSPIGPATWPLANVRVKAPSAESKADFAGADCREVELVDCDLSGARFTRADLRGALVTGARGLSLDVRESRTSGLRLDPASALDVVTALGIDIVDPPGD